MSVLQNVAAGTKVELTYTRQGKERKKTLNLAEAADCVQPGSWIPVRAADV